MRDPCPEIEMTQEIDLLQGIDFPIIITVPMEDQMKEIILILATIISIEVDPEAEEISLIIIIEEILMPGILILEIGLITGILTTILTEAISIITTEVMLTSEIVQEEPVLIVASQVMLLKNAIHCKMLCKTDLSIDLIITITMEITQEK